MKKKNEKWFVPLEPMNSTAHLDLSKAFPAPPMPKLKFSTESVTLRMPTDLLNKLKRLANQRDVPYQSLMKMLLADALDKKEKARA